MTVAPEVLAALLLAGRLVTGDALSCQTALRRQIRAQGGDYLVTVKANQPELQWALTTRFALPPVGERFATAVQALYERAAAWTATAAAARPAEREQARRALERALLAVCRAPSAKSPRATLCQRAERSHPDLFTGVADPVVPPTHNAAERALRPLVIARTISGGTRSSQGSQTRMVLCSLVATWDLRGCDPIHELRALLRAPRVPHPELGPV